MGLFGKYREGYGQGLHKNCEGVPDYIEYIADHPPQMEWEIPRSVRMKGKTNWDHLSIDIIGDEWLSNIMFMAVSFAIFFLVYWCPGARYTALLATNVAQVWARVQLNESHMIAKEEWAETIVLAIGIAGSLGVWSGGEMVSRCCLGGSIWSNILCGSM